LNLEREGVTKREGDLPNTLILQPKTHGNKISKKVFFEKNKKKSVKVEGKMAGKVP
jgi:hypothetical protein